MKKRKLFYALTIIFGVVNVGLFVALITLLALGKLDGNTLHTVLFVIGIFVSSFLATSFFNRSIAIRSADRALQLENAYSLGLANGFYNLYTFQKKAISLRKVHRYRDKKQYVIALIASNQSLMQNTRRNDEVSSLNANIAIAISEHFAARRDRKRWIYCFNHGTFLFYAIPQKREDLDAFMETMQDIVYNIVTENDLHIWVHPTFGLAPAPLDTELFKEIENATIALEVSERNFETVTIYEESFRTEVTLDERREMMDALRNNEFVVYYQAKYGLSSKSFVSAEALVRWNSPKFGLLTPDKFIEKATAIGIIHEINKFVFERVCQDLADAKRRGRRILPVSVNFSLYEFYTVKSIEWITRILGQYKVDPSLVQIEITESISQANKFLSMSIIRKLQEMGIHVLMDDFGIGYSNLGNLRKISFDGVKIDKSLIDNITTDSKAYEVVKALITVCKVSGMEVIAEGVSDKAQVDLLRRAKCDTIQGFYYSKALARPEYERLLADNPFEQKGGDRR